MFGSIKKVSIALLNFSGGDKVPSPIKCISLNNQSCMTTIGRVYFRKKAATIFKSRLSLKESPRCKNAVGGLGAL